MPLVKVGLALSNPTTHTGIADKNVFVQWPSLGFVNLSGSCRKCAASCKSLKSIATRFQSSFSLKCVDWTYFHKSFG